MRLGFVGGVENLVPNRGSHYGNFYKEWEGIFGEERNGDICHHDGYKDSNVDKSTKHVVVAMRRQKP